MDKPKTNKVIDDFSDKLTSEVKKNLSDSKSSGRLQSSLKITDKESSDDFSIIIEMEEYGTYVDEGRKPGKGVPVDNLKKWIVQKGITFNSQTKSKQTTEQKINSLAFLINRKIKKEGIEAKNFLSDALDELTPKFADDVANSFADDLIDDLFSDDIFS